MMGTCKSCKFWDAEHTFPSDATAYYESMGGMAECKNEKLDNVPDAKIVSSYDGPTQGFYTSPNFGCIHWEIKN